MSNFNPIRYVGALALLGLAACNTSQRVVQGETDNLYFMASDARVATEFAVKNNNPENFRDIEELRSVDAEQDNFSARNVNPDYIARYQRSQQPAEEGSVYFDDSQAQGGDIPQGNIDAYDNFRGSGGNGRGVTNNFFMNPMMGMGMGWGMPMMGMGMWDPFWGPGMGMWGPGMGWGMRPGFNMSIGLGMGWGGGFGWGNPWMMRPGFGMGMGWGNPWMMRPGFGMMGMGMWDPFWGPGMGMWGPGMGMWGRGFYNPVIIMPGGEMGRRQMVAAQRPTRGSSLAGATTAPRSRGEAVRSGSTRADARRQAVAASPNARQRAVQNTRNSFARSQNDLSSSPRASASPARRNISSPVAGRSGSQATRSAYAAPTTTRSSAARAATPSTYNTRTRSAQTQRSRYAAPSSRSSSPSYNRSGATRSSSPSMNRRSTAPSYQQRSAPSRSNYSSPSRSYSAPSRGYSGGGASRGGSVGGGRRGN